MASVSALVVLVTPLRRHAVLSRAALLLVGLCLAWGGTRHWLSLRVPASTADERVLFEGRILSVPAREGAEMHFDVTGTLVDGPDTRVRTARLTWRGRPTAPRVNERWRLLVRLAPLSETRNFVGADSARFAFRDRVHLAGRVLPSRLNLRLALANVSIDSMRARVAARIDDQVADPDAAALLVALSVGLTDRLSADQWRVFNATGTTHLVAISGLHITLFALIAFFVARLVWRWLHSLLPWARFVEREPFAVMLGLAAAGGVFIAGRLLGTRATYLADARLCRTGAARGAARGCGSHLDAGADRCPAARSLRAAVGGLLAVVRGSRRDSRGDQRGHRRSSAALVARVSNAVRLQFAIMLALAPLTFAVFDGLSIAGLWVNLIAIPLVSFVLVPLVLIGTLAVLVAPGFSQMPFSAAAALYDFAWPGLVWAADGELALWRATPSPWWIAFAALSGVVLLRRWPWSLRLSAVCVALPLLFVPAASARAGHRTRERLRRRTWFGRTGHHAFARAAVRYRRQLEHARGSPEAAHPAEARRAGAPRRGHAGAASAQRRPRTRRGVAGIRTPVHSVRVGGGWPATSLPVAPCTNSGFEWDGVEFRTYTSGPGGRYCVLRVSAGARGILLAGDLDAAAERALVSRIPASSRATWC